MIFQDIALKKTQAAKNPENDKGLAVGTDEGKRRTRRKFRAAETLWQGRQKKHRFPKFHAAANPGNQPAIKTKPSLCKDEPGSNASGQSQFMSNPSRSGNSLSLAAEGAGTYPTGHRNGS